MKRQLLIRNTLLLFFICIISIVFANRDSIIQKADKLSINDFENAIAFCDEQINKTNSEEEKAIFYRIKGRAYYFKGDFKEASFWYDRSIQALEKYNNQKELGLTFIEQAKLYRKTGMLPAAENTYQRALKIFTTLRDTLNLSTVYNENGVVYEYQKNYDKALAYYMQSLILKRAINDSVGMAYAYNFISGAYLLKNKTTEAEEYSLKSLNLFEALSDSFAVSLAYTDLAKIYLSAGKEALAKQAVENSNAFAQKTGYLDLLANNRLLLAEILKKQNNFSQALKEYEIYTKLKDSLYNEQMQKTVLELNTKYEVAQKDKDLIEKASALRIKNIFLISGLVGIGLLSILFLVTYRSSKLKHKTQLQKTIIEQQDFAAKSIIEAEENERQRMSSNLHDGLGQLLSAARMNIQAAEEKFAGNAEGQNSYNNIMSLIDDSIKEMRSVTHQMMPGAFVRQGLGSALKNLIEKIESPTLEVNLNIDGLNENYDLKIQIILYRIFQECINNVIKHASATRLYISLIQSKENIESTIEDNGVGFDARKLNNKAGIGLENIRCRVNFLKGNLDISSAPGKGTLIAFQIPINPNDEKN